MSKSVAIVTGASQGIGRATAIRLARDFSALVLVARGPRQSGRDRRGGEGRRRGSAGHRRRSEPALSGADGGRSGAGRVWPHRRAAQHRRRRAADRPVRDDRRAVGGRPRPEAARRAPADDRGMAGAEGGQGLGGADVGQFGAVSQSALRGGGHDQCRHRRAGEGVLRSRHRRRRAGQQRPAWSGDDGPSPLLSRALGAAAQHDASRRRRPASRRKPASPAMASRRKSRS